MDSVNHKLTLELKENLLHIYDHNEYIIVPLTNVAYVLSFDKSPKLNATTSSVKEVVVPEPEVTESTVQSTDKLRKRLQ